MMKIGVFCSASGSIDNKFFLKTAELGEWLGKQGKTLVYGGSALGLMECIAKSVKQNGGTVIGVVPSRVEENGKTCTFLDKIYKTKNLSDRKDIILEESDIMIALPGGVGTFDEIFHVMASSSIGYHNKKIIFYNIDGFYDSLLVILEQLSTNNFARHPLNHYFKVANSFGELTDLLNKKDND